MRKFGEPGGFMRDLDIDFVRAQVPAFAEPGLAEMALPIGALDAVL